MKVYDFLFELTCGDHEGEFILCEAEKSTATSIVVAGTRFQMSPANAGTGAPRR